MKDKIYSCRICDRQVTLPAGEAVPTCCGEKMSPLPYCTSAPNPEMARNYDADEPCDDGTGPKRKS
jgi:hypothetical protein